MMGTSIPRRLHAADIIGLSFSARAQQIKAQKDAAGLELASASGQNVELTPAHLAELAKAFPPGAAAGSRYPESQLVHMDSEKKAS
jgi:hypothetical protein